jgi:hypothetical protein
LSGFYTTVNPAILFDNIEGADGVWSMTDVSQERLENDVPAGDLKNPIRIFNAALANGQVEGILSGLAVPGDLSGVFTTTAPLQPAANP